MSDKIRALNAALAQIEKQYGKGAIMRLGQNTDMNVEAISTGSLGLDLATGIGGLPKGRIVEIYGPESSGKTTLALHCVAEAQKAGGQSPRCFQHSGLWPGTDWPGSSPPRNHSA